VLPLCDAVLVGLLPPTEPRLRDPVTVDPLVPCGVAAGAVLWTGVWLPLPIVT
jgi:hypothetical protein